MMTQIGTLTEAMKARGIANAAMLKAIELAPQLFTKEELVAATQEYYDSFLEIAASVTVPENSALSVDFVTGQIQARDLY